MKEIPLLRLWRAITVKRLYNAAKSLASLLASGLTGKSFVWGRPFILTIEPTSACNLRCPLCVTGNGSLLRNTGSMTLQTFERTLKLHADNLIYLLLYHQGEPYLNKNFLDFVRLAKLRRLFVTTSTNGHYLNRESAWQTVTSGLDSIIVSIDGMEQETYEKYRVGGALEQVKAGIKNLVSAKRLLGSRTPVIYVQFIVMKHNEHEIGAVKDLGFELGVDKVLIKSAQVETVPEANRWLPVASSYRRYLIDNGCLAPKRRGKGICPRPWTSTLVNWNGDVVPCCFDKHGQHTVGKVDAESTTEEIWHSQAYGHFRTQMLQNREKIAICSNCSQGLNLYF